MMAALSPVSPFPPKKDNELIGATTDSIYYATQMRYLGKSCVTLTFDKRAQTISIYASVFLSKKEPSPKRMAAYLIDFLNLDPVSFGLNVEQDRAACGGMFRGIAAHLNPTLHDLYLSSSQLVEVPSSFSDLFQACPNLTRLELGSVFRGQDEWVIADQTAKKIGSALSALRALKTIELRNIRMSEKASCHIFQVLAQSAPELNTFQLKGLSLHPRTCLSISSVLASHPDLNRFSLRNAQLSRVQSAALFCGLLTLPSLSHLDLSGDRIHIDHTTGRALSLFLANTTSLTTLELPPVKTDGLEGLKEGLKENATLERLTLRFSGNQEVQSVMAIAEVIETNTVLTDLALDQFSAHSHWQRMGDALISTGTLNRLTICDGDPLMGDEGAVELARALEQNSSLYTLDLSGATCGRDGFHALAQSLHRNTTLLDCSLPRIDAPDAIPDILDLSKLIQCNQTLERLVYRGHRRPPEEGLDLGAVAEAISQNATLRSLHFSVRVSQQEFERFVQSIAINDTLTTLTGLTYVRGDNTDTTAVERPLGTMLYNNRIRQSTLFRLLFDRVG